MTKEQDDKEYELSLLSLKKDKVLDTLFLKDWNTTALILEHGIVVRLFNDKYMTREECFSHIHKYCAGWVQTSERYREYERKGENHGMQPDPILPYEKLFEHLLTYTVEKFGEEYKGSKNLKE